MKPPEQKLEADKLVGAQTIHYISIPSTEMALAFVLRSCQDDVVLITERPAERSATLCRE
jgi:hypothetical protein